jgi:formate-nitrite transporter family protein
MPQPEEQQPGSELITPELTDRERKEAEERIAVTAPIVHEAIRQQGDQELARSGSGLAWSGSAAGLSMGFSLVAEGLFRAHLPDADWRPLIAKLGYPMGFLLVILGRQQLFTENTLMVIIPLMARRNMATLLRVLRLWAIVLISNLTGAHIFAWVAGNTRVFRPEVQQAFAGVDVSDALLRGIFAGWLIAMVVWLIAAGQVRADCDHRDSDVYRRAGRLYPYHRGLGGGAVSGNDRSSFLGSLRGRIHVPDAAG